MSKRKTRSSTKGKKTEAEDEPQQKKAKTAPSSSGEGKETKTVQSEDDPTDYQPYKDRTALYGAPNAEMTRAYRTLLAMEVQINQNQEGSNKWLFLGTRQPTDGPRLQKVNTVATAKFHPYGGILDHDQFIEENKEALNDAYNWELMALVRNVTLPYVQTMLGSGDGTKVTIWVERCWIWSDDGKTIKAYLVSTRSMDSLSFECFRHGILKLEYKSHDDRVRAATEKFQIARIRDNLA